jgi:hypothetical protein
MRCGDVVQDLALEVYEFVGDVHPVRLVIFLANIAIVMQ